MRVLKFDSSTLCKEEEGVNADFIFVSHACLI
jgi:hypothetical protein